MRVMLALAIAGVLAACASFGPGTIDGARAPIENIVKPHWAENARANSSTVRAGDRFVGNMVQAVMASRYWPKAAVVIT